MLSAVWVSFSLGCGGAPSSRGACGAEFEEPPDIPVFEGEVHVEDDGAPYCAADQALSEWCRRNLPCWEGDECPSFDEFLSLVGFSVEGDFEFTVPTGTGAGNMSAVRLCEDHDRFDLRKTPGGYYDFWFELDGSLSAMRFAYFDTPHLCGVTEVDAAWWGEGPQTRFTADQDCVSYSHGVWALPTDTGEPTTVDAEQQTGCGCRGGPSGPDALGWASLLVALAGARARRRSAP